MEREKRGGTQGVGKKLYSVASHAAKMGWDFADPGAPSWTKQITRVGRISSVEGPRIRLVDGGALEDVDLLCFATGYLYAFPFCHPADQPWALHPLTRPPPPPPSSSSSSTPPPSAHPHPHLQGGFRVHNLDETQLFYFPDPSFAFLVLHTQVVPFPLAEYQARAIAARWSGRKVFALEPMSDEETESKEVHVLAVPKEYEYEQMLLERIGEGTPVADSDTHWGPVPAWKPVARQEGPAKRRLELGY